MTVRKWQSAFVGMALACGAVSGADEVPDLSGSELYQHLCASCHGGKGRGDGPVAATLKSKVPDLTRIAARHGGVFPTEQVQQKIDGLEVAPAHGTRDMPVWGWQLYAIEGEDDVRRKRVADLIGRLAEHLASIQRK